MDDHVIVVYLKVNPVILGTVAMEFLALSLNGAEPAVFSMDVFKVLVAHLELIEQFKLDNPRDPFPSELRWVADRSDRYNRNLWMRIEELATEGQPGLMAVSREGNNFTVTADSVDAFTLLLSPEEVNFSQEITVMVNGRILYVGRVSQDMNTLADWAVRDRDKSMLYTAALSLRINP